MTEETRKLFDAPWFPFSRACDFHGLKRSNGSEIFSDASFRSEVNRLARLPELYDKLMWAAVQHCPDAFLTLDECRLCPDKKCEYREIVELLKKVRDGE